MSEMKTLVKEWESNPIQYIGSDLNNKYYFVNGQLKTVPKYLWQEPEEPSFGRRLI